MIMATTDEVIFIKQLLLAEDIKFGVGNEAQVRNGIAVNGEKVNTDHLIFNSPASPHHGKTLTEILVILLDSTGA